MRTSRRLAGPALAAAAAVALGACSATVRPTVAAAPTTPTMATHRPVAPAAGTGRATPAPTRTPTRMPTSTPTRPPTSATDLPVPGDGVSGDEGLCLAVAGWYGYASLALIGAGQDGGHVFPDDIVPVLDALTLAPDDHADASHELLTTAQDIADQTQDVITEIQHGAEAADAVSELDQPMTLFSNACIAEGIQV